MLVQELKDLPAKKVRVVFEDAEDLVLYRGEIRKYRIEEGEDLPEDLLSGDRKTCEETRDASVGKDGPDRKRSEGKTADERISTGACR